MQVWQHLGLGGSVVEDHEDFEGDALRYAIFLQLMDQLNLAVGLENMVRHPTTGVGEPVDGQAGLVIALNPFTPRRHDNIKTPHTDPSRECRKLGRCRDGMRCCRISAMLPYLEITHTESHCHVDLCLIKPSTLWELFGLDVPDLTYPTSCRCRWMGES